METITRAVIVSHHSESSLWRFNDFDSFHADCFVLPITLFQRHFKNDNKLKDTKDEEKNTKLKDKKDIKDKKKDTKHKDKKKGYKGWEKR